MMKDILLILFLLSSFLYAEINERKSDVYFANGIDTSKKVHMYQEFKSIFGLTILKSDYIVI